MYDKKSLLIKALIWRFAIAIPMGMVVTYFFVRDFDLVATLTIVINIISTVLYYLYDILWSKLHKGREMKNKRE